MFHPLVWAPNGVLWLNCQYDAWQKMILNSITPSAFLNCHFIVTQRFFSSPHLLMHLFIYIYLDKWLPILFNGLAHYSHCLDVQIMSTFGWREAPDLLLPALFSAPFLTFRQSKVCHTHLALGLPSLEGRVFPKGSLFITVENCA